jgi:antirestriction protein ArdC
MRRSLPGPTQNPIHKQEKERHVMSNKVYEIVTEKIIAALESGTAPWHKPWKAGIARNATTNRPYSGIKALLLGMTPYSDPRWITMKQCNAKGGKIRKGEKSSLVTFWKQNTITPESDDGEITEKQIPMLRCYLVWNVEQCEGLDLPALETKQIDPIAQAEEIVANMPGKPRIGHDGGDKAYYMPLTDSIHLPTRNSFDSSGEYYSTLYHELTHSTGHQSRLNRPTLTEVVPFGSETYSKEELVAEFGAAFLCAHAGIENTVNNSAAYINGWLRKLQSDPKLAILAASQGQKAADYILGAGAKSN